jgi:hypothetical protein
MIDLVVERKHMREVIASCLGFMVGPPAEAPSSTGQATQVPSSGS